MSEIKPTHCSFCSKSQEQVVKLVVAPGAGICNECIELCSKILSKKPKVADANSEFNLDPQAIYNYMDQYVVAQGYAKEKLAVSVVNHYKRCLFDDKNRIEKTNILFWGPTGTGKTLLAKTIAEFLGVKFVIVDATTLTEAGYVGDDTSAIIEKLYQAADNDVGETERGIVFIDEVDKIARKNEPFTGGKDVNGEGVQQALLKLVEGTRIKITTPRKGFGSDTVEINTAKILFIASGAFVGLDDLVKRRRSTANMGFTSNAISTSVSRLPADSVDFVKFGMIPEFMGRFPSIVHTNNLTVADLCQVIQNTNNGILEQYKFYFAANQIELNIDDAVVAAIANHAVKMNLGARGLRSIFELITHDYLFNIGTLTENNVKQITLTTEDVQKYL
jgi:ATP-dependent Clp protease ATP-binding subunit ClpX